MNDLLSSAAQSWMGAVPWGTRVPLNNPGVYLVALSETPDLLTNQDHCPISGTAVQELLDARPELRLDGYRPDTAELTDRLASMWLGDETVLYVGLAGTSVANRVSQYYRTPLGARRPHAGGWPLKVLANLGLLWVHYAACPDVDAAEQTMLHTFLSNVSESARNAVCDPQLPLPFANLTVPVR